MRSKYLFWFLGTLSFCEKVQMSNFKAWFDVERIDDDSFNGMFLYQFNLDLRLKIFVKQKNILKNIYNFCRLTGCDLSYGPENTGNTTILENFLPPYRTFKVTPNSSIVNWYIANLSVGVPAGGQHLLLGVPRVPGRGGRVARQRHHQLHHG